MKKLLAAKAIGLERGATAFADMRSGIMTADQSTEDKGLSASELIGTRISSAGQAFASFDQETVVPGGSKET